MPGSLQALSCTRLCRGNIPAEAFNRRDRGEFAKNAEEVSRPEFDEPLPGSVLVCYSNLHTLRWAASPSQRVPDNRRYPGCDQYPREAMRNHSGQGVHDLGAELYH